MRCDFRFTFSIVVFWQTRRLKRATKCCFLRPECALKIFHMGPCRRLQASLCCFVSPGLECRRTSRGRTCAPPRPEIGVRVSSGYRVSLGRDPLLPFKFPCSPTRHRNLVSHPFWVTCAPDTRPVSKREACNYPKKSPD